MVSHRVAGAGGCFRGGHGALYLFLMAADRLEERPAVELGLDFPYQPSQRANVVTRVYTNSPAERAGLKVGDQVVAFDGRRVESPADQERVWMSREPGDSVRLTIQRPGQTAPFELTGVFRRNSDLGGTAGSLQAAVGRLLRTSVVLAFAAVGLVILLLRPEDRNVWLLACFFSPHRFGLRVPRITSKRRPRRYDSGSSFTAGSSWAPLGPRSTSCARCSRRALRLTGGFPGSNGLP